MERRRGVGPVVAAILGALALAACGDARRVGAGDSTAECDRCHARATLRGAHAAHLAADLDCGACHVKPPPRDRSHVDGVATISWGPSATANGTLTPGYERSSGACTSVYCHGAFTGGNASNAPHWTRTGEAGCGTCHDIPPGGAHPPWEMDASSCAACHPDTVTAAGALIRGRGTAHVDGKVSLEPGHDRPWMDPSGPRFHAFAANRHFASCAPCHGADLGGGTSGVGCGGCHDANLPAGVASWRVNCVMCHGGRNDATGAPPKATWGRAGDAVRVGAHGTHLSASDVSPGFGCEVCHVRPASALTPGHIDASTAAVTFAGLAVNGVSPAPGWDRATASCSNVYCHGATMGGTAPSWTSVGTAGCGTCHGVPPAQGHPAVTGGRPACSVCHATAIDLAGEVIAPSAGGTHLNGLVDAQGHGEGWMDTASAAFHAFSANRNLLACTRCHGGDLGGGATGVGCGQCHGRDLPQGVSWSVNCVMCHGGTQNATGAPPKTTWGRAGDALRVGAHTVHVTAGDLSPAFGCEVCHVKPASALTPGHLDGETANVTFGGLAVNGVSPAPQWVRSSATCSNTYCHGATMGGTAPAWTSTGTAGCGTCHGIPPGGGHPAVSGGLAACSGCHPATVDASGSVIPSGSGGAHLNGAVDAQGHGEGWMDTASATFHAFAANRDLASCTMCHGPDLAGGSTGVACGDCHDRDNPPGVASWAVNCVMCHGGTQNTTGAPPKATWGRAADAIRVGAHTAHVTAGDLSPAFGCGVCHVRPASALTPGHLDAETATVTFAGLAVNGVTPAPQWSRASATCSNTYCHGATMGGTAPAWTSAGTAGCGTCHGVPPLQDHPAVTGGLAACAGCHPATVDRGGSVIAPSAGGAHLNGLVDAQGHDEGWMDTASATFHAYAANRNLASCTGCHGTDLAGGSTGVGCGGCHGRNLPPGVASWTVNCVMCHGGTDNATGAPPEATWGKAADRTRVGAHTVHVSPSDLSPGFGCDVCHVKPASALAPGHLDADTATVTFAGLAVNGVTPAPGWDRATVTCSNTYCHGATMGGTAPPWTSTGTAGCGTCHAVPPKGDHPAVTGGLAACAGCHPATIDAAGDLIPPIAGGAHLNGIVDAEGHGEAWMDLASATFHAFAANRSLASCTSCHGADLGGGSTGVACGDCHDRDNPPGVTSWAVNCVMCHGGTQNATGAPPKVTWGRVADAVRVGAHTAHVTAGDLSPAFGCDVCHVTPASALTPGHLDAEAATVAFAGLAVNGVSPAPQWSRATATCSNTYCHGATMGGTAPAWTTTGTAGCGTCHGLPPVGHTPVSGGLGACAGCHPTTMDAAGDVIAPSAGGAHLNGHVDAQGHDAAWMDTASATFHAFYANRHLASCTGCHGTDLSGGSSGVACGDCHDRDNPPGVTSWAVNCVMCHGGTQNSTGAPPKATWGRAADAVRVGAHTAHVTASELSPAFGCDVCHVTPASALTSGHLDAETATVTFAGLAVNGVTPAPQWTRTTATCSNTYCHGATMGGTAPAWTSTGTAGCGTCHGLPPTGHAPVSGGLGACAGCHSTTMDAAGNVILPTAGGAHLNGLVDAQGHGTEWMQTASAGFHAFAANRNLASCTGCHGSDLSGGSGRACGACHDRNLPPGIASWAVNCVMCHGGTDNSSGAPPDATWGRAADAVRVGAHTAHLSPSGLSPGFGCAVCHVTPTSALAPGHLDAETATVTFAGLAVNGVAPAPQWNRATARCSNTYCHGTTMGGTAPEWTSTGTAGCGTCHGLPPVGHAPVSGGLPSCVGCHPATMDPLGRVIAPSAGGRHLNGLVDAQGHDAAWMDRSSSRFHAFSANRNLAGCTGCHGSDLSGGSSGRACGECHDRNLPPGVASWAVNCVMCHGGTDNGTGAPPEATWGRAADPVRVGAHTAHLSPSGLSPGFGCAVCHVTPASALAVGHLDAETATLTFSGVAVSGATPPPEWDRATATCSNVRCHGATMGGTAPDWTSTGTAGCGTCHGLPPVGHAPVSGGLAACVGCHPATMGAAGNVIAPSAGGAHLNGVVDAQGHDAAWMQTASAGFHAFAANRNLASCTGCHGSDLSGGSGRACGACHDRNLPPGVTSWTGNCVMCHGGTDNGTGAPPQATWGRAADPLRVGAHTKHVSPGDVSPGFGCDVCHVKPASALAPGHLDSETATVTFAGVAVSGAAPAPQWNRATGTCSNTYCHGATMGGTAPAWTSTGSAGCGTCHPLPPPLHPSTSGDLYACTLCHPRTIDGTGSLVAPSAGGTHLNGLVDLEGWDSSCLSCH